MLQPNLLEEFSTGLDVVNTNPAVLTMANAKWMGNLLIAISESHFGNGADLDELCTRYREVASDLVRAIGGDVSDKRLLNSALQSIILPATKEIKETGRLDAHWLPSYAESIKNLPAFFKISTSPITASTSLGMTLTNHYADLLAMVNSFAYLNDPAEVVTWASNLIDTAAKQSADRIAPQEEQGSAYQNQLNVMRKLFKSVYNAEAKQWIEMLSDHPESASLYAQGIPLSGVEIRFREQVETIRDLLAINARAKSITPTR